MTKEFSSSIKQIIDTFNTELASITSFKELDLLTARFTGKKGSVTILFQSIKTVSIEEKKVFAPQLNNLKIIISEAVSTKKQSSFTK